MFRVASVFSNWVGEYLCSSRAAGERLGLCLEVKVADGLEPTAAVSSPSASSSLLWSVNLSFFLAGEDVGLFRLLLLLVLTELGPAFPLEARFFATLLSSSSLSAGAAVTFPVASVFSNWVGEYLCSSRAAGERLGRCLEVKVVDGLGSSSAAASSSSASGSLLSSVVSVCLNGVGVNLCSSRAAGECADGLGLTAAASSSSASGSLLSSVVFVCSNWVGEYLWSSRAAGERLGLCLEVKVADSLESTAPASSPSASSSLLLSVKLSFSVAEEGAGLFCLLLLLVLTTEPGPAFPLEVPLFATFLSSSSSASSARAAPLVVTGIHTPRTASQS